MLGQQHPGLPGMRGALPADPRGAEQSRSVPSGRASPCPVRSARSICCWAPGQLGAITAPLQERGKVTSDPDLCRAGGLSQA